MKNLGVCIETFFYDLPYRQRLEKIAALGFKRYEFWFHDMRFDGAAIHPERRDFDMIAEMNERLGLTVTDFIFNHPDAGVKAALINPADRAMLHDGLSGMLENAKKIGCTAFISGSGNMIDGMSREAAFENMVETLKQLAPACEKEGVTLLLEPFNTRVDHPGYFLDDPALGIKTVKTVGSPSVKLLYDIYHMQIMSGNILAFVKDNLEHIGHFHIAGVPGRHEPAACELNYAFIVKSITAMGYRGGFGLEYWPVGNHETSLKKTLAYFG